MVEAWVQNLVPSEAFRLDLPFTNEVEFETATAQVPDYNRMHAPAVCIWFFQAIGPDEADQCVQSFAQKISNCHYNFGVLPVASQPMHGLQQAERAQILAQRGNIANVIVRNDLTLLDAANPHADGERDGQFEFGLDLVFGVFFESVGAGMKNLEKQPVGGLQRCRERVRDRDRAADCQVATFFRRAQI